MFSSIKQDFSFSAFIAGLIVVLVGMTSSAVVVFQAAQAFGVSNEYIGSWLGSLCIGMGLLTIYFSLKFKVPVLMAWSTPGAVLLVSAAQGYSLNEAIGAFLISSVLVFLSGVTGLFHRLMNSIPQSLTSGLLAGVLFHFCIDAINLMNKEMILIGTMFMTYLISRKFFNQFTMLFVLVVGVFLAFISGRLSIDQLNFSFTQFQITAPLFNLKAFFSLAVPLFIVTMASQNLTGISVMRNFHIHIPISQVITGMGCINLLTSFFGGFTINLAAITAAIAMGPDCHPQLNRRYIAAIVSGILYIAIGFFATTVTSLFAALPKAVIVAIAGLALLNTVSASLEKTFSQDQFKESAFLTFIVATSGIEILGIGSAFWAVVIGLITYFFQKHKKQIVAKI